MRRSALVLALVVALVAVLPIAAFADTTGSLAGRVRDVTGRPVAGVSVRVDSPEEVMQTTSDADGRYRFVGLVPGTYTVTIAKAGYATRSFPGVAVFAGSQAVADELLYGAKAIWIVMRDYTAMELVRPNLTADLYEIPSYHPLFASSRTIGDLLPFVPGVQVTGGSPYPR